MIELKSFERLLLREEFRHDEVLTDSEKLTNVSYFFFNDTATTEIYTLSLHDALPISACPSIGRPRTRCAPWQAPVLPSRASDRKSTRLNSSHANISYAVFCLKKKQR